MAAVATAVNLLLRVSRLQEAAVVSQERAWVHESVGDLAERGKSLLDVIATKSFNYAPSAGGAIVGCSGFLLPASRSRATKAEIDSNHQAVESLVINRHLAARIDYGGASNLSLHSAQVAQVASVAADIQQGGDGGQGVGYSIRRGAAATEASGSTWPLEEDDYGWETDPNGGWLASFP